MAKKDKRVDAYIKDSPEFAQPILKEFRARVHAAVPGITETIKWNSPFFMLHEDRIFASMAAFKAHTKFLIWNADFKSEMPKSDDFKSLKDLPTKAAFAKSLKAAAKTFKPKAE